MKKIKANYTEFGLKVKEELARRRLTQTWLAENLGVTSAYISNILFGVSCPDARIEEIKQLLWGEQEKIDKPMI